MILQNRVPGHPIDVILIEDTAVDAELVADALGEAGLAIALRRVQDEPALRAALDERLPDAILADWSLPRYSGRRALTLAQERCPEVPFIFVSGTISESAAIEALRHGAVDYVYKHNLQELGPALIRALDEVRTQRLLHESLAFNRSILDSVSAEIAVLDPQGVILAVNRPWQSFALENGIEPGQPAPGTEVGTNYLAVCRAGAGMTADADAVNAGNGIRAVLNGTQTDFQLEYPCHSPTQQRWFSMNVRRLEPDGRGAVITHTDITKRKQAEMALRKSKDLLQSIVDHVPARVFWKDQQLRYLGANTMFARDAGCTEPCELTGKTDLDMPWKGQAESYRADDRAVIESGGPKLRYEEPQTTPTGNTIWLRTSKVPMRDEANQVIGLLGIYEDITEERLIAEELVGHRDHLEELVDIRTRDLEDARSEADRANRAKTEFISTMSHELRSPLNAILGFAQLLEFDSPPPTPAQQDNINRILKAGWHLLTLINEILDLGKIESGKAQLALEPVSLTQVIRECCDLVAHAGATVRHPVDHPPGRSILYCPRRSNTGEAGTDQPAVQRDQI